MTRLKNGRWLCLGRECHSVYEASEVIDPENEDYGLYTAAGEAVASGVEPRGETIAPMA